MAQRETFWGPGIQCALSRRLLLSLIASYAINEIETFTNAMAGA